MMNVSYSYEGKKSGARFKRFLENRLQSGLERFDARIESVAVRVSEEDRSGMANCRIQVEISPTGVAHASGRGENHYQAATEAIQRLKQTLSRDIELRRHARKIRRRRPIKRDVAAFAEV